MDGDHAILSLASRKAQKANVSIQFDHALSYSLPYPAAHFDRVVSSLFFHHLSWENKKRAARELFQVLKPGAELHVADRGRADNTLMRGLFLFVQFLDGFKNTMEQWHSIVRSNPANASLNLTPCMGASRLVARGLAGRYAFSAPTGQDAELKP